MSRRTRERTPTKEELELWAHVTKHDQPIAPPERMPLSAFDEANVSLSGEEKVLQPGIPDGTPIQLDGKLPLLTAKGQVSPINLALLAEKGAISSLPVTVRRQPSRPETFDPRLGRRLSRGQTEIDARLDLHGMRQADAHDALHRFLFRSQAAGHRNVLVITGKGRGSTLDGAGFPWKLDESGVLRRAVPLWLREPGLSPIVVSFKQSSQHHGGSGALYIVLRRPVRVKGL